MTRPSLRASGDFGEPAGYASLTIEDTWDVFDRAGAAVDTVPRRQDAEHILRDLGAVRVFYSRQPWSGAE